MPDVLFTLNLIQAPQTGQTSTANIPPLHFNGPLLGESEAPLIKSDLAVEARLLSPLRGSNSITSPSDSSSDGPPTTAAVSQNGLISNSLATAIITSSLTTPTASRSGPSAFQLCSTAAQTEPISPPLIPSTSPSSNSPPSSSSAAALSIESLQRRISELEVESGAQRQTITLAQEHTIKSLQLIQDLLVEKVSFTNVICETI